MLLQYNMMSLNGYEISTYEKIHVKLKNLLNMLVKKCKLFKKSESVISMRTSIPKIEQCYHFWSIAQVMFGERENFVHHSENVKYRNF